VKSSPSTGSPRRAGISESRNVIPEAPAFLRVGGEMEPPLDEARRQLRLTVGAIVKVLGPCRRDDDEGGVARQSLVECDAIQLLP
jgi:hypothetical protein